MKTLDDLKKELAAAQQRTKEAEDAYDEERPDVRALNRCLSEEGRIKREMWELGWRG